MEIFLTILMGLIAISCVLCGFNQFDKGNEMSSALGFFIAGAAFMTMIIMF